MTTIESPVSQQMVDADFRAALAADPEAAHGLTLSPAERAVLARLCPLLALPAETLLQRLLGGPDGGPWWWGSSPSLAGYLE